MITVRFANHAVVEVNEVGFSSTIFDPSYGTKYVGNTMADTEEIWENSNLQNTLYVLNTGAIATIANDPNIKELNFN